MGSFSPKRFGAAGGGGSSGISPTTPLATFAGVADVPIMFDPQVSRGLRYRDDFLDFISSVFAVTATGANTMTGSATHPGQYVQTVSAANDVARASMGTSNTQVGVLFGGGPWEIEGQSRFPTLSDATNNIVLRVGFFDGVAGDAVDGAYLEYDFATHGHHKWMLCASSNSVRTKTDTGILAVAGNETNWLVMMNAAGTSLTASIDGVAAAAAVTTNIPTAAGRQTQVQLQAFKQLGAGALTVVHDYYEVRHVLTVAR